jgi:hypothetical protein
MPPNLRRQSHLQPFLGMAVSHISPPHTPLSSTPSWCEREREWVCVTGVKGVCGLGVVVVVCGAGVTQVKIRAHGTKTEGRAMST